MATITKTTGPDIGKLKDVDEISGSDAQELTDLRLILEADWAVSKHEAQQRGDSDTVRVLDECHPKMGRAISAGTETRLLENIRGLDDMSKAMITTVIMAARENPERVMSMIDTATGLTGKEIRVKVGLRGPLMGKILKACQE